ncbi:MAG: PQQ-dependent sugar dehydrogenase [Saprospiraceae bacterium]|nr:PQQ-dependent sugar dehydrogenase [Saprospiraceae bacterium]
MKAFLVLFFLAFNFSLYSQFPSGFAAFQIGGQLNPTDMAVSPDGRIFITEKDGLVRIVENDILLVDPFLVMQVEDFNEQGLGHIALHPSFPTQPYVYLYFTVADSNGFSHNKVIRVEADGNQAIPGSETLIYNCDSSPGTIHHGGDMVFGADGKLYISTGDKGYSHLVQSLESDLGKVLRLNPDGSIPGNNPYFSQTFGKYRAIYAYGFRNPYSMAVQPETGRIFISDVGSSSWEEVNELFSGKNYGWPIVEGKKTNQNLPSNYQDPLYAYDHNTGCSIIGAAFSPQSGGNFPAAYAGRFFFADYCQGYIKSLHANTGQDEVLFASGINRPVGVVFNAAGEMYYLARAGLGGGTYEDNTESENGAVWKVIFTNSDAPFVYQDPKNVHLVGGENHEFLVQALGKKPLHYRWQKDGVDLTVADTNILHLTNVQLADSNSIYRCIVTNTSGVDTSQTATMWVTNNQRPLLEIQLPTSDFLYRAGASIPFSGVAIDPETGPIHPAQTTWKIDFHHDEHIHPVMVPTPNLDYEEVFVPSVGEVDDQVWYRFYFSAKDPAGLSRSIYRDILPLKTSILVESNKPEVPVDADGFWGATPYLFQSVAGIKRSVRVPTFISEPDSVWIFKTWNDGTSTALRQFTTPDSLQLTISAQFDTYAKANGFGLLGEYFLESAAPWGFDEPMRMSRIDSIVNFEWVEGSPAPGSLPIDGFTVRWSGQVVPYSDALYTFYSVTDDGARLWVNDSLLIDHWEPQPTLEHNGAIFLQKGKRYDIRFDFLELGGVATAKLLWSTDKMPKEPIPQRQLYPPRHLIPSKIEGRVWLDVIRNNMLDVEDEMLEGASILLLSEQNLVVAGALTDSAGWYALPAVPAGAYKMYVLPPINVYNMEPGLNLYPDGLTEGFILAGDTLLKQSFTFVIGSLNHATDASTSWRVTPNPTRNLAFFRKTLNALNESFRIQVRTLEGRILFEQSLEAGQWESELDFSGLPPGMYLIKAGNKTEKMIKQ